MNAPLLTLASGSPYKKLLLARLGVHFNTFDADIDESPQPDEPPDQLALRLARAKAAAGASKASGSCIIGADQVASSERQAVIGKPGNATANRQMLLDLAGAEVRFFTAVALLDGRTGTVQEALDVTRVVYRRYDDATVDRYLALEPAWDCAGGCKVEGLGITLLEEVESTDPTALLGLPLIALSKLLAGAGFTLPPESG